MDAINNVVVVSDLHCGCQLGLCPPEGAVLDNGGTYHPSTLQLGIWDWWREFWDVWVPEATKGEPFAVVVNGDAVDGTHHNSTSQITHSITDQARIARAVLAPVVAQCEGRFYHIRGTPAHVGESGCDEERLARDLGAIPNRVGQHARNELWKMVGPRLAHIVHAIGTTSSQAYESTAVHRELTESFLEAGRWQRRPPDVIVRSHRHRHIETNLATINGRAFAVVTPGWQGRTPYAYRIAGGRLSEPQFGGIVVRWAHDELFLRSWVRSPEREAAE